MHGSGLGAAVGYAVEKVAHARILCALFSCAEVVIHHLIQNAVRNATTTVGDPTKISSTTLCLVSSFICLRNAYKSFAKMVPQTICIYIYIKKMFMYVKKISHLESN